MALQNENVFTMALDVYIQPKVEAPRVGSDYELVAQLDYDGYFVFLSPLFEELKQKTGQTIDLYENAVFGGIHLNDLRDTVTAGKRLVDSQPEKWDVWIGTQTYPVRKELYATVRKQELERMLDEIEAAVAKAKANGSYITFWGD